MRDGRSLAAAGGRRLSTEQSRLDRLNRVSRASAVLGRVPDQIPRTATVIRPAASASRQRDDQDAAPLSPCAPGRLRGLRTGTHGRLADYYRRCSMRDTMIWCEG